MRAQVIVIPGNETSELGFNRLLKSYQDTQQEFSINSFDASTPFTAESEMRDFDITWNYPWEGQVSDFATGLIKRAYVGRDPKARMACAMSACIESNPLRAGRRSHHRRGNAMRV